MGLDMGITIKSKTPLNKSIFEECKYFGDTSKDLYTYEAFHHRKDWGLRNSILHYLAKTRLPEFIEDNDNEIYLISKDCDELIKIVKYWDNRERWDNDGRSIWDYKEDNIHRHLKRDIKELKQLKKLLKKDHTIVAYWYDSF